MFDELAYQIQTHAKVEFPNESCGVIVSNNYIPLKNISQTPHDNFNCSKELSEYLINTSVQALVHSHTNGKERPSSLDISQQFLMEIPWGITITNGTGASVPYYFGDQIDPPKLEGRQFRWGPSGTDNKGDCAALLRDWYRINKKIILKDFPRPDEITPEDFKKHGDLYFNNLTESGFEPADSRFPEIGDLALIKTNHKGPPNHVIIYVGNGWGIHHMEGRLSCRVPMINYASSQSKLMAYWLRHNGS